MTMSRWKMMAGVLGVSIGGLAAAASQCPKLDKTKGRQPETPVSVAEAPKVPPAGAASAPPAPPSLPLPATTPAPTIPTPTAPALPALPTAEIPAPPPMKAAPLPAVPAFPDVPTLPTPQPAKPEPTKLPEPPVVTFPALPTTPTTPDTKPVDLQLPPSRLPVDPPMTTPAKPPVTDLVPPMPMKPTGTQPAEKTLFIPAPGNPPIDVTPALPSVPTEVKPVEKPMPAGGIFSKPNTTQSPATAVSTIAQTGSTAPAQPPTTGVIAAPGLTTPQAPEVTTVAPAGTKFRILLSVGDGMPMFEVKDGDNLVLKVVCEKVDIKSPEKGQGLSAVTARGKVRFAGFGAEGTCEELSFLAGTGEVSMTGDVKVQVKDKLGRVESEISSSTLKYKIDSNAVGGTLKP